ncbi:MAG: HlyD family efflux transporter periplasmic adaptor subunit [Burkholderiales bacterium]|nr:HlyD family efflux transporter periplasmic adaptor subunit [Burkholderiales bacterium]
MYRTWAIFLVFLLAGCGKPPADEWQGYIEGEFVLLASPYAGQLQQLHVRRGDQVETGRPVFVLEQESERAARLEAGEWLNNAQARLENLEVARRTPEIDAQRAELAQAQTARELSALQLAQQEKLFQAGFISQARYDEARTAHERDVARVLAAEAQLKNVLQPLGRDAERKAAAAEVAAARAALAQAIWRLEQKSVAAPVTGLVQDTFFVMGEWVPAGRPVASLLPPGNVKARFYVAGDKLSSVPVGREVILQCDGCEPVAARVTFTSSQAEYTPPVLYSKESRQKLVFLVEARPEATDALKLRPGQPVDVRPK